MWLSEVEAELRQQAAKLNFFDASAWLGNTPDFPIMREGTPELLGDIQKKSYIDKALVSHWVCGNDSSQGGNRRLLQEIDGHDNWYATITVNPLFPEDPESPGSPEWEWDRKVKAVRIFPSAFKFALVDWCVGSLCEMLIERHLPLFVFHSEADFRDLYQLANRYPELQIIIESQPRKIMYNVRMILPLMKACPNIHLEISNFCTQGMIEYTAKTLGAERLIFGTFAPANDPLVPIGMLLQADIPWDDKLSIAGGNIAGLISEVQS